MSTRVVIVLICIVAFALLYMYYILRNNKERNDVDNEGNIDHYNDEYNDVTINDNYGLYDDLSSIANEQVNDDRNYYENGNVPISLPSSSTLTSTTSTQSLSGGAPTVLSTNTGVSSYCFVDGNVFTKYYIELNDDRIYSRKMHVVINGITLTLSPHRELDIHRYVNKTISPPPLPKLLSGCEDIPFDENIYNNIRMAKYHDKNRIQLKKLVMEKVDGITVQQYFINNGLVLAENKREIVSNNVPTRLFINVYRSYFQLLMKFFRHNIIPKDSDNLNNIFVHNKSTNEKAIVVPIDAALYTTIDRRNGKITDSDLLCYYFFNMFYCNRRDSLDFVVMMQRHNDCEYIFRQSLYKVVNNNVINMLWNKYVHPPQSVVRTKLTVLQYLTGENSVRSFDVRDLFKMYMCDRKKYEQLKEKCDKLMKGLNVEWNSCYDTMTLKRIWNYVYSLKLTNAEQSYMFMHTPGGKGMTMERLHEMVKEVIEIDSKTNVSLKLIQSSIAPYLYVSHNKGKGNVKNVMNNKGKKVIETTKYFKLEKGNEGIGTRTKYVGLCENDDKYFFDALIPASVETMEMMYVVFDM